MAKAAGAADFSRPLRRAAISTAVRCRDGEGRTQRSTCHSPLSSPLCHLHLPSFSARFHREFQPLAAVIPTPPDSPSLRWLPRRLRASRSARSAEQGNNSNSSHSGGPCRQTDRHKYTQTHTTAVPAAGEGGVHSQELDYGTAVSLGCVDDAGLSLVAWTALCGFPHHGCGVEKPFLCKASAVSWLSRSVFSVGMDLV